MLLEIQNGTVSRGGEEILLHFDFCIKGQEHIGLIGGNGAGKTTLLEVLAESIELDRDDKRDGVGFQKSRNLTVSYLFQDLSSYEGRKVSDFTIQGKEDIFYENLGHLGGQNLPPEKLFSECSGGEKKKIVLSHILLLEPDLLLLDEPTNDLDMDALIWLEQFLKKYKSAFIIVSHDRYFLDQVTDVTYEIADKKAHRFSGNYSFYKKEKQLLLERKEKAYLEQQKEIQREKELIQRFQHKPTKASFVKSRKKMLERMELLEKPSGFGRAIRRNAIIPTNRGPKNVCLIEKLIIGYDREHPLKELNLRIRRGQKIGIIGKNGTGKTTFLKTLIGDVQPLSGKLTLGNGIEISYFDQKSAEITSEKSVFEYIRDEFPSYREKEIRELLAGYLFYKDDLGKKVSSLSGGEKSRLVLLSILEKKPNFLVLDEPTNHMDIPSKEAMESVFKSYQGTLIVISHDRYFLSEVAEQLLIFDGEKSPMEVLFYPFSYPYYVERLKIGEIGEDFSLLRSREEQRMIEGLRSVPEKERHRLKEYSTEELNRDWRYEQNRGRREESEQKVIEELTDSSYISEGYVSLEDYMNGTYDEAMESKKEKVEKASEEWTEDLLDWYDIYLETHPKL